MTLGIPGDVPIAGRWNGGNTATVGVFRPSNGALYLRNTNTSGMADTTLTYGLPGDKPVTGDWDGNGTDTIGVYRDGTFYLRNSNTNGFADLTFTLGVRGRRPDRGLLGGAAGARRGAAVRPRPAIAAVPPTGSGTSRAGRLCTRGRTR